MSDPNYSQEEALKEQEMETNPDAHKGSFDYSHYTMVNDVHVYKSLATVGDFYCKIWYRQEEFDDDRLNGERTVILVGTNDGEPFIEDSLVLHRYFQQSGTVFVNAKYRQQLTDLVYANRDLKDCVKWLSSCIGKYNGNNAPIKLVDTNNNELTYTMIYDDIALSLECSDSESPLTLDATYPNTMPLDAPIKNWGQDTAGEPDIAYGSVSKNYNLFFTTMANISMSGLKSNLGASANNIGSYYRGGANVGNISQNNSIPTSGTIKFSHFHNACNKIEANCSGNFDHMRTRHDVFNESEWTGNINKTVILSGHAGSRAQNQPAVRFNQSAGGNTIEFQITGGGRAYGWAGSPAGYNLSQGPVDGSGTLTNGGPGGYAIHLACPTKISGGTWNGAIAGGGGGGGKGGQGGKGGCGGHGGARRCNGSFCWNTKRVCHYNGGQGGEGGAGGRGAWGLGYSWDPSAGWWVNISGTHLTQPGAGAQGAAGSSRGGARGGQGGTGGTGGGLEGSGNTGQTGQQGHTGSGDEQGCNYPCGRTGAQGAGGTPGGSPSGKYSSSGNGSRYS